VTVPYWLACDRLYDPRGPRLTSPANRFWVARLRRHHLPRRRLRPAAAEPSNIGQWIDAIDYADVSHD
jgi:hypothetical protein